MLLRALHAHLDVLAHGGDQDRSVHRVTRDSREAAVDCLFVAIRGERFDGHSALATLPSGAAALVEDSAGVPDGVSWIQVADTRRALGWASAAVAGWPTHRLPVVGITGTNGKTTVATLLSGLLEGVGRAVVQVGTTGVRVAGRPVAGGLTTPEAPELHRWFAEGLQAGAEAAVMEASSIGLAMHRTDAIGFTVAVFTMFGRDHLDVHGTLEAYLAAKAILFQPDQLRAVGGAPRALLCGDDPVWRALRPPEDRWLYGLGEDCDVRAHNIALGTHGLRFDVRTPLGDTTVQTRLVGTVNVVNATAALAAALLLGVPLDEAAAALARVPGPPGRLEAVSQPGGPLVLVDYAHTPDALEVAIAAAREARPDGRLWLVFGCGGARDAGKRPLMGSVALSADEVVVTSDNPRNEDPETIVAEILSGMSGRTPIVQLDRAEAIAHAVTAAGPADVVLVAGKGHETTQEIAGVKRSFDDRLVARAALEAR